MKNNLLLLSALIMLAACKATIKNTQFPSEFKCFEIEMPHFFRQIHTTCRRVYTQSNVVSQKGIRHLRDIKS